MKPTDWIWRDGKFVSWADATVHVSTHALHYGSAVFEGIRAYNTPRGTQFFRLRDHLHRLRDSAAIYYMPLRHDMATLAEASKELVRKNKLPAAYVRPVVFRGTGPLTLDPTDNTVETIVMAWEWGKYLAHSGDGVDVCISSWRRAAGSTMPALAKASGNYLSSQLIRLEARRNGYHEGIALTTDGIVGEASGENVFAVYRGTLLTPDIASSVLLGVTRDTVLRLAGDLGIPVQEARIPRELLIAADEVFLCGTAAEITPVRSIDKAVVGTGKPGEVTRAIQRAFFGLFDGSTPDRHEWLEPVEAR
jgi:branched-chain amino acid aminotransferase